VLSLSQSLSLSLSLSVSLSNGLHSISQVVFAYARLEAYDQGLFDAAAKEITRTAQDASPQAASQART